MARKLTLRLAPSVNLNLNLKPPQIKLNRALLLDLIIKLNRLLWLVFFVLAFSAQLFKDQADLGSLLWVYVFMLMLLGLQIIKKILGKGDYLPIVAYDAQLLLFTTFSAISLFASTINASNKNLNIWGGEDLRFISGLSIIAFWFLYYLTLANFSEKEGFAKLVKLLGISILLGLVFSVISGAGILLGLATIYIILLPSWLWLLLFETKARWFYFLNLLVAILLWRQIIDPVNTFVVWLVFAISFILLFLKNRLQLKKLFTRLNSDIDKLISKKLKLSQLLVKNAQVIYLVLAGLVSMIGIAWLVANKASGIFDLLTSGLSVFVKDLTVTNFFLGRGLVTIEGSFLTQLLYSYGVVVLLVLFFTVGLAIKDLLKYFFKKDVSKLSLFASIVGVLLLMFLGKITDIIMLTFWLVFTLIGVYKMTQIDKRVIQINKGVREASPDLKENVRRTLHFVQFLAVIIIVVAVVYTLTLISKLTLFIDR